MASAVCFVVGLVVGAAAAHVRSVRLRDLAREYREDADANIKLAEAYCIHEAAQCRATMRIATQRLNEARRREAGRG